MRRIAFSVALLIVTAVGAAAQDSKTPMQMIEDAKQQERQAIQQQYEAGRAARERNQAPDGGKGDPWAGMRGSEASAKKPEKKTAKKPANPPPPKPLSAR